MLSGELARLPWPLAIILVAALCTVGLLYAHPALAVALLALACSLDLALLLSLPRLAVSFGPARPPWLLFAGGRALLAAPIALAPLSAAGELIALAALQALLLALSLYATLIEPFRIEETRLRLSLPGIGGPLRLLLLSDLHLERWTRREARVLQAVRSGTADAILIAGDYFNLSYVGEAGAAAAARALLEAIAATAPPAGVFAVRGTTEVDPRETVHALFAGLPIRLLEDELASLEHGPARLQLLGVCADGAPAERGARLAALAVASDPARPRLCLHHTPDLIEEAARLGLPLYLAGHTHGGQICAPLLGPLVTASRFGRRYARGLKRVGGLTAYVSRGIGLEGLGAPRMRFLARPELVWLELDEPDGERRATAAGTAERGPSGSR